MKIKAKSKLEEHILSHLTPEGEFLDLEDKNVSPEHLRLLCQAGETLQRVKQLDLSNNGLGDTEIEFLSKSRCLPNLEKLFLNHNKISNAGAKTLAESKLVRNISCLMLEANQIGVNGAQPLATSLNLKNLALQA